MCTMAKAVTQYQKALRVCGYHVYKDIWEVAVGKTVVCKVIFMTEMLLLLRKKEESLAICHRRYDTSMLFF